MQIFSGIYSGLEWMGLHTQPLDNDRQRLLKRSLFDFPRIFQDDHQGKVRSHLAFVREAYFSDQARPARRGEGSKA